jgi:SdpC family antimicrobial peptide
MQDRLPGSSRVRSERRPSRIITAALIGIAMAVTATVVVSPGHGASAAPAPSSSEKRFDGGELLIGLSFGLGPVGESYPDLAMVRVTNTAENTAVAERLVAEIDRREPDFLDGYAAAMYSGDHVRISDAVAEAAQLVRSAAPASGAVPSNAPIQTTLADQSLDVDLDFSLDNLQTLDISLYFYRHVVIAVEVAVAAFFFYGVNFGMFLPLRPPGADEERLTFERWVDRVATAMAAG